MAYAIIETGGKQLRVEPGRFYDVERLPIAENESVSIDRVLFIENDGDVSIGQPLVAGATVEATVLRHLRGRKIIVYKMRPKKKTRKKQGHRQELTRLMIDAINLNGSVVAENEEATQSSSAQTTEVVDVAPAIEVSSTPDFEAAPIEVQAQPVELNPDAIDTDVIDPDASEESDVIDVDASDVDTPVEATIDEE
jgi:large subunit ribosomal protein L21